MKRSQHLLVDKAIFNESFNNVHAWLDKFAHDKDKIGYKHWLERHYLIAVSKKFKDREYLVAYIHILCDFIYHFGVVWVPETRLRLEDFLKAKGAIRK